MAGFLYFVPNGREPLNVKALRELGFEHADVAGLPGCGANKGPSDASEGSTFALSFAMTPGGQSPKVGFYPDTQKWQPILDGRIYLGWETAKPPTPEDLQCKDPSGLPVPLQDGNKWIVPVYRDLAKNTTLPTILGVDANGSMVQNKVLPKFQHVWGLTQRVVKVMTGIDATALSQDEKFEFACIALSENYHVSRWEISALGILTTDNLACVLAAILGVRQDG